MHVLLLKGNTYFFSHSVSSRSRSASELPGTKVHNSVRNRTTSESSMSTNSIAEIVDSSIDTNNPSFIQSLNISHNATDTNQNNNVILRREDNSPIEDDTKQETNLNNRESMSSSSVNSEEEFKDAIDAKIPTFFSSMKAR